MPAGGAVVRRPPATPGIRTNSVGVHRPRRLARLLLIIASVAGCGAADASAPVDRLESASRNPTWLKLLHYGANRASPTGLRSAIHSPEFFIAPTGRDDPLAELNATIRSLEQAQSGDAEPDRGIPCRFPARTMWLRAQGLVDAGRDGEWSCPRFRKWSLDGSATSISVIHVAGYLGNPASFYGHILLKLNSADGRRSSSLEDVTVNYGAIVPKQENPVIYMAKGLIGRYEASFSHIDYYFHDHNYREVELRDMWEYELALSPAEMALVTAHAWELLGQRYDYYFFRENCAFRMAELVDLADGVHATSSNPVWMMPQDLVRNLAATQRAGEPLVRAIRYDPSRQTRYYERYFALDEADRRLVGRIARHKESLDSPALVAEPIARQRRILDTLLDYYAFAKNNDAIDKAAVATDRQRTLMRRFEIPEEGDTPTAQPPAARPQSGSEGRPPSRVSAGLGWSRSGVAALSLGLRPAYYDGLDSDAGHVRNSELAMADMGLRFAEHHADVDYLHLLTVRRAARRYTGLPGDLGDAWDVRVGLEQRALGCFPCAVFRAQGDWGYSAPLGEDIVVAGFLGGGAQDRGRGYGPAFARVSLLAQAGLNADRRAQLRLEHRRFLGGATPTQNLAEIVARRRLGDRFDMRVFGRVDGTSEAGIALGWYW